MKPTEGGSRRFGKAEVEALRKAVSPDQLRQMADDFPQAEADLLRRLATAMEDEDPAAALSEVVAEVWGDRSSDQAEGGVFLEKLSESFRPVFDVLGAVTGGASEDVERLAREQARFREAAKVEESEPALREALEALGDPGLLASISGILADIGSAVASVGDVVNRTGEGRSVDPDTLHRLESRLLDLETRARAADPTDRLLDAFSVLRSRLEEGDVSKAPDAALMEAMLRQARVERAGGTELDPMWEHALALAERFGSLSVAQDAAQALQADAVRRGDFARVAEVARRVVRVADADGEYRPRVMSRLEEALAVAHSGAPTRGFDLADQAHDLARELELPELAGRAVIAQGQILEQVGGNQDAAKLYRRLLRDLTETEDPGIGAVVGRAAMGLARCLPQGPERLRSWQLAQGLGIKLGDRLLYIHGSLGIIEHHLEIDDRLAAVAGLVQFRTAAAQMGGPEAALPFDKVAAGLEQEWGKEAFERELRAFRAKMPYA